MLTRREFHLLGGGTALLAMPLLAEMSQREETYRSTLVDGFTPATVHWGGREWRCNMGSTWQMGMEHCLRLTSKSARFEIRNSPHDHSRADKAHKRRSELSGKVPKSPALLPNGVPLWSAMSFVHHSWADPAGMAALTGGVHGQVHMGRSFGGSPAVAFRRTDTGQFAVTTRGQRAPQSVPRFTGPLAFDQPHDLVFRLLLHPERGSLAVWLDGRQIVDVAGASIGSETPDSHWNIGCYFAGGVTCPVVAEFANVVYPGAASLARRTARPAVWPVVGPTSAASQFIAMNSAGEQ